MSNLDPKTISSFSHEWSSFDQSKLGTKELYALFANYFSIFPNDYLNKHSVGFDMGCGSGRWAQFIAPQVGTLHCIDPSSAINVAKSNLRHQTNVVFHNLASCNVDLPDNVADFGYSLGVLHHIPDTQQALMDCVRLLKPGAPFLLYLYYSLDNRSLSYRSLWKASDFMRSIISQLPPHLKQLTTDSIAYFIYFPLSRFSKLLSYFNLPFRSVPLSYYKDSSLYTLRTDSRDRFGTPLEKRFALQEIYAMCTKAGLKDVTHSPNPPYWVVLGYKQ